MSPRRDSRPYRRWGLVALVIVLVGFGGSLWTALAVDHVGDQRAHRAFIDSSAEITDTLKLYVHHQLDLITSIESFLIGDPTPTSAQFTSWTKAVDLLGHNKDLSGLGVVNYVTAAQLPAFIRAQSTPSSPFVVTPPGHRAYYCFATMGVVRSSFAKTPRGSDLCSSAEGPLILSARSSGRGDVIPYDSAGKNLIAFETPLYRGGATPTSVAARDKDFVAIIALTVNPKIILASSLENYPGMAASLGNGTTSQPVFTSGVALPDSQHVAKSLGNGWTAEIYGSRGNLNFFSSTNALGVLLGGMALSVVVAALMFLLGTDRTRLRRLVDERTEQLHFQATHDALTDLPNRVLIVDRMDQLLTRNRRRGTSGAVLFIDLDDFKNVNDSLGHDAGDRLLTLVAARMRAALREADTIGRVGGDEFVVLVDGGEDSSAPEIVAQRLLDALRAPFELDGSLLPLIVNTSIGIAVGDRPSGNMLLRDADVALYQAKAKGKNKYVFFEPSMEEAIGRRLALEFDLRSALADHQFLLLYQPVYALEDLTIVGVEALLRWQHPRLGLLGPDEFIPALERTGQIREVGAWVLKEASAQVAVWHERGDALYLTVNVSGRQFDDHLLIDQIRSAVSTSGFDPRRLTIEVTETALMLDMASVVRDLHKIKEMGVSIAIDDFGTGYSSLSSLRELPVDCIKIDQSFISSIATSEESMALVRTFIQLGADLGLKTVAEGVETFEQMDLLRASHVNFVQGFLFSRPLAPRELEEHLLEPRRPLRTNESNPPAVPPSQVD